MIDENNPQDQNLVNLDEAPRSRSASFVSVYSNSAQVTSSFYDFRITFAEIGLSADGGKKRLLVTEVASVVMTWEHAKALHDLLGKKIEGFESKFGKVRQRPEVTEVEG